MHPSTVYKHLNNGHDYTVCISDSVSILTMLVFLSFSPDLKFYPGLLILWIPSLFPNNCKLSKYFNLQLKLLKSTQFPISRFQILVL